MIRANSCQGLNSRFPEVPIIGVIGFPCYYWYTGLFSAGYLVHTLFLFGRAPFGRGGLNWLASLD